MTFQEWLKTTGSEHSDIETFKRRMEYGDAGNPDNKWIAAGIAYEAGIQEGKRLALQQLALVIYDRRDIEVDNPHVKTD